MIRVKQIVIIGGFSDMRRGAPTIIRRGMFRMAREWHQSMLPKHFRRGAAAIYGYQKRKAKYARRKSRKGLPPLVWSGETQRWARAHFHVTGSAKHVRGKLWMVPWYVRMTPMRRGLPAVGLELTKTTRRERVVLAKRLRRQVTAGLNAIRTRKVIRP